MTLEIINLEMSNFENLLWSSDFLLRIFFPAPGYLVLVLATFELKERGAG